eukprot:TRINITY_DN321_c0_g1_i1.p1 TRINITY_DN321_c0_g1~~TRINITY_DN321_c0_g1_i1.p1  ORF type:complete len:486 (+),score=113.88 TRINITY_DN321_c0_g1_i1:28-1485(+)
MKKIMVIGEPPHSLRAKIDNIPQEKRTEDIEEADTFFVEFKRDLSLPAIQVLNSKWDNMNVEIFFFHDHELFSQGHVPSEVSDGKECSYQQYRDDCCWFVQRGSTTVQQILDFSLDPNRVYFHECFVSRDVDDILSLEVCGVEESNKQGLLDEEEKNEESNQLVNNQYDEDSAEAQSNQKVVLDNLAEEEIFETQSNQLVNNQYDEDSVEAQSNQQAPDTLLEKIAEIEQIVLDNQEKISGIESTQQLLLGNQETMISMFKELKAEFREGSKRSHDKSDKTKNYERTDRLKKELNEYIHMAEELKTSLLRKEEEIVKLNGKINELKAQNSSKFWRDEYNLIIELDGIFDDLSYSAYDIFQYMEEEKITVLNWSIFQALERGAQREEFDGAINSLYSNTFEAGLELKGEGKKIWRPIADRLFSFHERKNRLDPIQIVIPGLGDAYNEEEHIIYEGREDGKVKTVEKLGIRHHIDGKIIRKAKVILA